jgi:integral membrane protein
MTTASSQAARSLRHLRLASIFEGITLLTLLGIAVPLKHLAGMPQAVSVAGPVHGLAFLVYLWVSMNVGACSNWSGRETARVLGAAFLPFGFISTLRFIQRQESAGRAAS